MGTFEIHGHRGVPSLMPENTLEGFAMAIALGATALELDVSLSLEGVVIVSHEPIADAGLYRVRETPDGHAARGAASAAGILGTPWSELSMRRIGTLDAGSPGWLGTGADPFVGTRRSVPGARVPTLDAVFRLARRLRARHLRFEIEAKSDPTGRVASPDAIALAHAISAVVRRHGMVRRARLRAFDWRVLRAARRSAPGLRTVALVRIDTASRGSAWLQGVPFGGRRWATAVTSGALELSAAAVAPADAVVDREFMAASRRAGLAVLPWTVNSAERARELIALGVTGLTTDHPGTMRGLVDESAAAQSSPGSSR